MKKIGNLPLHQVRGDAAHTGNPLDAGPDVELTVGVFGVGPVSYTHLDVYKRQAWP